MNVQNAKNKCRSVIEEWVEPFLLSKGFHRRRKWDFERWNNDCMEDIDLGSSKVRGHDAVEVTIGISVGFRSILQFWDNSPILPESELADPNHPRILGGELMLLSRGGVDATRVINEDILVEDAGMDINDEIGMYALPFFEKYRHLENAMEAWRNGEMACGRPSGPAYLAAAHWLRGEKEDAWTVIEKEVEYERQRYEEFPNHIRKRHLEEAKLLYSEFKQRASTFGAL